MAEEASNNKQQVNLFVLVPIVVAAVGATYTVVDALRITPLKDSVETCLRDKAARLDICEAQKAVVLADKDAANIKLAALQAEVAQLKSDRSAFIQQRDELAVQLSRALKAPPPPPQWRHIANRSESLIVGECTGQSEMVLKCDERTRGRRIFVAPNQYSQGPTQVEFKTLESPEAQGWLIELDPTSTEAKIKGSGSCGSDRNESMLVKVMECQ